MARQLRSIRMEKVFSGFKRLKFMQLLGYMAGVLEKYDDKVWSAAEITENYCSKIRQCILMSLTLLHTRDINQRQVQESCRNLISLLYKWDLMWKSEIFPVFNALERILISVFTHSKPLYAFPLGKTKLFVHFFFCEKRFNCNPFIC